MISPTAQEVLDFWFGLPSDLDFGQPKKSWFIKRKAFDDEIRNRFLRIHEQAILGDLDDWQNLPESCLALIIVLDQFARNLFRGTPKSFKADTKALAIAKHAIQKEFDQQLCPIQRWFIYLPFEHSESLADQGCSLRLWDTLRGHEPSASAIQYAEQHAAVIQRFGRFPHRNIILNRQSTEAELEFLKQPGSAF